ncbi:hypothetical protein CL653_01950 [bacterium]|nr:hypothetical protein [bacterium]
MTNIVTTETENRLRQTDSWKQLDPHGILEVTAETILENILNDFSMLNDKSRLSKQDMSFMVKEQIRQTVTGMKLG